MTGVPYDRTLSMLRVGVLKALAFKYAGLSLASVRFEEQDVICFPKMIVALPTGVVAFEVPLGNVFSEDEIANLVSWTVSRVYAIASGQPDPQRDLRNSLKQTAFGSMYGKGSFKPDFSGFTYKVADYNYSGEKHPRAGDKISDATDFVSRAVNVAKVANVQAVSALTHERIAKSLFG